MEQEQEKEIMVGSDFLQLEGTGMTAQAVTIGGKNYAIHAPSILCLQKVGECLALMATVEMNDKTLDEGIRMMTDKNTLALAVSYILKGDDSLKDELASEATEELQEVIIICHGMTIKAMKLLKSLAKSIGKLIAKQKL